MLLSEIPIMLLERQITEEPLETLTVFKVKAVVQGEVFGPAQIQPMLQGSLAEQIPIQIQAALDYSAINNNKEMVLQLLAWHPTTTQLTEEIIRNKNRFKQIPSVLQATVLLAINSQHKTVWDSIATLEITLLAKEVNLKTNFKAHLHLDRAIILPLVSIMEVNPTHKTTTQTRQELDGELVGNFNSKANHSKDSNNKDKNLYQ